MRGGAWDVVPDIFPRVALSQWRRGDQASEILVVVARVIEERKHQGIAVHILPLLWSLQANRSQGEPST